MDNEVEAAPRVEVVAQRNGVPHGEVHCIDLGDGMGSVHYHSEVARQAAIALDEGLDFAYTFAPFP